jgi:hypothetical protein
VASGWLMGNCAKIKDHAVKGFWDTKHVAVQKCAQLTGLVAESAACDPSARCCATLPRNTHQHCGLRAAANTFQRSNSKSGRPSAEAELPSYCSALTDDVEHR